jgi:hypothetical protein
MKPKARRERLLYEEVGDELVLYDLLRHRAHHLNRAAALVWRSCDGHKTVAELRKVLQKELDPAVDEGIVWQAVERLGRARLLQEPLRRRAAASGITRRQALRRLGQTAALALLVPAVTSILAPTPLRAGEHDCDELPCTEACEDKCTQDSDCTKNNPKCVLLDCRNPTCVGCTQRRCTKTATASQIDGAGD